MKTSKMPTQLRAPDKYNDVMVSPYDSRLGGSVLGLEFVRTSGLKDPPFIDQRDTRRQEFDFQHVM